MIQLWYNSAVIRKFDDLFFYIVSPPASLETLGSQRENIFSFLLIEDSRKAEEGRKEKNIRCGNM